MTRDTIITTYCDFCERRGWYPKYRHGPVIHITCPKCVGGKNSSPVWHRAYIALGGGAGYDCDTWAHQQTEALVAKAIQWTKNNAWATPVRAIAIAQCGICWHGIEIRRQRAEMRREVERPRKLAATKRELMMRRHPDLVSAFVARYRAGRFAATLYDLMTQQERQWALNKLNYSTLYHHDLAGAC